jgi:hypothetical protein
MSRELTEEEKLWCLEQAIAIVKEAGHGGASNVLVSCSTGALLPHCQHQPAPWQNVPSRIAKGGNSRGSA